MAQPHTLARPPITEALIDLRVTPSDRTTREVLAEVKRLVGKDYSQCDERLAGQAQFTVKDGKILTSGLEQAFDGWWCHNEAKNRIVQFRRNGFTHNHLAPYETGERLLEESLRLWGYYADRVHPDVVQKIGVRYINQLRLPWREGDDFSRFLTSAPGLPNDSPQQVSAFHSRVMAHEPGDPEATLIVTQKLERLPESPVVVVIDIEAFIGSATEPGVSQLRSSIKRLLQLKNRVFFSLLTDAAIEQFS